MYKLLKKSAALLLAGFIFSAATFPVYADKWITRDNVEKYQYEDGSYAKNQWITVGDDRYFIKEDCTAAKSWINIDGYYYYFKKNGKLLKASSKNSYAALSIGSNKYYFDSSGKWDSKTRDLNGNVTSDSDTPKNPSKTTKKITTITTTTTTTTITTTTVVKTTNTTEATNISDK